MNPYKALGIPNTATDQAIRQAYLAAIKACPPEYDATQFRKLTTAYESIKDIDSRLHNIVFRPKPDGSTPLEVTMDYARTESPVPSDLGTLKHFLRNLA